MEKSEYFKEAIDPELSISYQTGRRKASLARMPDQIRRIVLFCCVCVLGFLTYVAKPSIWSIDGKSATPVLQDPSGSECPQASPISSSLHADLLKLLEKEFASEEYKAKAYETLGGAVRIPTVVLAFGIDEERGGISGATAIRDHLLTTYGEDAFSILVDEGGFQELREDVLIAYPAVAEKGSFNLRIEVSTPGGHSSVPPAHTGIGILAALVTELEEHPHPIQLYRNATFYESLQCQAAHDPKLPPHLKNLIKGSLNSDKALLELETELLETNPQFKAIAGTTQAVDIIGGGVKVNALPESTFAIVNHRIAGHSSVGALKAHITTVLGPVAERFNLSFDAFGGGAGHAANGLVTLSDAFDTGLEPAPITSTSGSGPYELLSGTIINTIESSPRKAYSGKKAVVAPSISLGNTDTKHYWNLTKHIFRYGHKGGFDAYNGAHTVNEAIRAEGFLEMIRFFSQLILNSDQTDLLE
ncbi:hypothetical protein EW026_g8286 [Hermanssonia centrifuga]|uniref:Peptidase M20 dimerisation domain-containing protein n=1 Tax=Hermanssonia centrifuga TaxID=98765 RepID=A0A4S4K4P9_9APHY|nr:hypothetical protein EW026_g8286 [Hermanssonia centrifuga]